MSFLIKDDHKSNFYFCKGSRLFVPYPRESLYKIDGHLVLEPVILSQNSVFAGPDYPHHAAGGYLGLANFHHMYNCPRKTKTFKILLCLRVNGTTKLTTMTQRKKNLHKKIM